MQEFEDKKQFFQVRDTFDQEQYKDLLKDLGQQNSRLTQFKQDMMMIEKAIRELSDPTRYATILDKDKIYKLKGLMAKRSALKEKEDKLLEQVAQMKAE